MKKKILLTGSSGTVGREVLKQLIELNKYNITIMCRKSALRKTFIKYFLPKINCIVVDFEQVEKKPEIKEKFDVVIHLAAVIPPLANTNLPLANSINVGATEYLLEQIKKYNSEAFFMYSSSISVYGDRITNPHITTSDPVNISLGDHYAKTKAKAESAIQNSALDWTIFRLTAIMGLNNHKISPLMFHMPLNTSIEICTPMDTARAFVNGIEKRNELKNKIFNLGGGENCRTTYEKFLEKNLKINGLGKLKFPKKCFAEKNFHCGFYSDGELLQQITNFRTDTLSDYYQMNSNRVSFFKRTIASMFTPIIRLLLMRKSEPYLAYKSNDESMKKRFFLD